MIEKLKTLEDDEIDTPVGAVNTRFQDTELVRKINEIVDAVNKQEQVIKILIDGLECFAKGQQLMNTEIEIKG